MGGDEHFIAPLPSIGSIPPSNIVVQGIFINTCAPCEETQFSFVNENDIVSTLGREPVRETPLSLRRSGARCHLVSLAPCTIYEQRVLFSLGGALLSSFLH
ncbi:hypothetical protein CDAR_238471 [Caerostris darwini]|uniref:Uncharacterized protein n=1 Tax=Caerostris darwini TaxID=1538125 RepID=A0AAV4W6E5_9ARAC|nr:hypothetical protein CDAR_238471 [Caerostris darwini]